MNYQVLAEESLWRITKMLEYGPFHRKIEPLHDRVLVERIPEPERLVTLTDAEKSKIARVLAVGPGRWIDGEFCKTAVKPGDVVIIPGAGGKWPDWEQKDTILIQEGDIGGILG